ncbi:MAG: DUF2254 domain-containing protein [Deltaproteobacteria bacterium]|nr:MAG: DUF2254 domain-containing protein [Deltaproteobacteria bacterium]
MSTEQAPYRDAAFTFAMLALVSGGMYGSLYVLELGFASPIALVSGPGVVDTLSGLGEVTVGVLGIAITVVAIIVELAANRYTPRITELFLRDATNLAVMGFFVVTAVLVLWTDMSLYGETWPRALVLLSLSMMTVSLLALLPYFAYVFDFLAPTRVIQTIRGRSSLALARVRAGGDVAEGREAVLGAIEQLGELALNAVEAKDKGISIASVGALCQLATDHLAVKNSLDPEFFQTHTLANTDQDFIALHPDMVEALADRRTWVEMKVLRQYQAVVPATVHRMQDITHLVSIRTRHIGEEAARRKDRPVVQLAIRFFNTYFRACINAKDVRSAYNLMNEYRGLAEALLEEQLLEEVLDAARRFQFYGQLAFHGNLGFIQETVAYDLCVVIQRAHEQNAPIHDALLGILLELDREPEQGGAQEASLRGVRKAQIKLATYYLKAGDARYAQRIWDDMAHEKRARLFSIREEILEVAEAEYWEVSDRGIHFDYLDPELRPYLDDFFAWFDGTVTLPPLE